MAEPLPICYLNGEYQQLRDARISPLDRGFLFGDGVYEVLPVFGGRMFRFREHFDVLGKHLTNAKNKHEEATSTLARVEAKLEDVTGRGAQGALPGV